MKVSLFVSVAALLCGGFALIAVLRDSSDAPQVQEVALRPDPGVPPEILERLDELSEENRSLQDRLLMMEGSALATDPAAEARRPMDVNYVTQEDFDAFRDEVKDLLQESSPLLAAKSSPELKDTVADALTQIRNEETEAKVEAWRQRSLDRLDSAMPKLESALGLSRQQSLDLRTELEVNFERNADLGRRWKSGEEDATVLGQEKRANQESHQAALSTILTPNQIEDLPAALREAGVSGK